MQTLLLGGPTVSCREGRPEPGGSTSTESRISGSFGSLCEQRHLVLPYYPFAHAATAVRCQHCVVLLNRRHVGSALVRGSRRARRLIQPVVKGVPRPLSRDFDLAGVQNLACDPSLMKSVPTRDPPNRRCRRATHHGNRSPPNVAWLAGRVGRWRRRARSCPHRTAPSQSAPRGRAAQSARGARRTGGGAPPGRTGRRRGCERRTVPRLRV